MTTANEGWGPCHLCGSETEERHGAILYGCCQSQIDPDRTMTVEVCEECLAAVRADPESRPCPKEK